MFKEISRNNRLFMTANFLFALSYGLWMNLRQLHLGHLGATTVEIGTVMGIVALAGGLLPLPTGLLTDRIGPKRIILGAWCVAILGTIIAALATTWPMAGVGFAVYMLVIAANPATASYVMLNMTDHHQSGQAERVMATVFASWPAAMIFAPTLGGLIADRWGITGDLCLGIVGFGCAIACFALAADVRPVHTESKLGFRSILGNRRFFMLAIFFPIVMLTLYIGHMLLPTYFEGVRSYTTSAIGLLFSLLSIGSLFFNYVVSRLRPQWSFVVLVSAVWLGIFLIWQTDYPALMGLAFLLQGALSSFWLLSQATYGQSVTPEQRGSALGITETLAWGSAALASWLAGQLYVRTPSHDLPLIVGVVAILIVLLAWFFFSRFIRESKAETSHTPEQTA